MLASQVYEIEFCPFLASQMNAPSQESRAQLEWLLCLASALQAAKSSSLGASVSQHE